MKDGRHIEQIEKLRYSYLSNGLTDRHEIFGMMTRVDPLHPNSHQMFELLKSKMAEDSRLEN